MTLAAATTVAVSTPRRQIPESPQRAAARASVLALTRVDVRTRLHSRAGALGEMALLSLLDPARAREFARARGIPAALAAPSEQSRDAFRDLVFELAEERAVSAALALERFDLHDGASWRAAYDAAYSLASFVVYEDCIAHVDALFDDELAAAPFPRA